MYIIFREYFIREIIIAVITLILCYLLKVSRIEFIIILLVIAVVIVSEIFNTAIEKVVDLYTKDYNEIARIDMEMQKQTNDLNQLEKNVNAVMTIQILIDGIEDKENNKDLISELNFRHTHSKHSSKDSLENCSFASSVSVPQLYTVYSCTSRVIKYSSSITQVSFSYLIFINYS